MPQYSEYLSYTIPMALVDFVPVIFFAVAAFLLTRDLYNKMSRNAYLFFSAGVINIICAGALKALHKLLVAAEICNFQALYDIFFPVQSIGFLLAGIGMIMMLVGRGKGTNLASLTVVPALFKGTMVFIMLMCTGLGALIVGLCILASKMKKKWLIALFVVSFVCSLGMGYLGSKEVNEWLKQGLNTVGQGTLLVGVYLLHKAGLCELSLKKG